MEPNDNKAIEIFRSAPVPKAVLQNCVPAMIGMVMTLFYNLADTFFIGQTHDDILVASIALATPVFLLLTAFGTIFSVGGTSVISRALGEGKHEYARKVSSFCTWSCVVIGILVGAFLIVFIDPVLSMTGASSDTWEPAKTYLIIIAVCGPFSLLGSCFQGLTRAEGKATVSMTGMMVGNILNIILDPIFILALDGGIAGAAWATVIGNAAAAVYYLIYYIRGRSVLSIRPKDFTVKDGILTGVLAIGIPSSLATVTMSISQILLNSTISSYNDMALAASGVATKVTMFVSTICMGMGTGVQPLVGFCVGAKMWERFRKVMRFSFILSMGAGAAMALICYLFAPQIVNVFLTDQSAFSYGVHFARILLSTSFLFGSFNVLSNAIQGMGAAKESLVVNIARQGIIYIPALYLMNSLLGLDGTLWAQPVSDVLAFVLALGLYFVTYKKLLHSSDVQFEKEAVISGRKLKEAEL